MMMGHLQLPQLDDRPHRPATLSEAVVRGLLRKELGFKELIFTDALDMKGVTNYYAKGEVEVEAFVAGNDVLLFCEDVPVAAAAIKEALKEGRISREQLEQSVARILGAKQRLDLFNSCKLPDTAPNENDLFPAEAAPLLQQLAEKSICLTGAKPKVAEGAAVVALRMHNKKQLSSVREPLLAHHALSADGSEGEDVFSETLLQEALKAADKRLKFHQVDLSDESKAAERLSTCWAEVESASQVIVCLHGLHQRGQKDFSLTQELSAAIKQLSEHKDFTLVLFGNPFIADLLAGAESAKSIVHAYHDSPATQQAAANVLLGKKNVVGTLPVKVNPGSKPLFS